MFIIFALISTTTVIVPTVHAKYCATASDDTLYIYPSPNNCSKFIVCFNNEEIEMSCLESSLFMFTNERLCLEACSLEMTTVRQRIRGSKASYDFSSDYLLFPSYDIPKQTIICPSSGSTTAAIPQNCEEYIECNDGMGMRRKCDNGYEFSPSSYKCTIQNESDCVVNKRLRGTYSPKCRFVKSNSSSFIFPSENCFEFQKCANLRAWTITCAQNTSFSKDERSCEWNDEVKC